VRGWKVNETGSGSYPGAGLGIIIVQLSGSVQSYLSDYFLLQLKGEKFIRKLFEDLNSDIRPSSCQVKRSGLRESSTSLFFISTKQIRDFVVRR
jgi:hypothetical protein